MQQQRIYSRQHYKPGQFFLFGVIVILAIVFADQYTKWLVMETMLRASGDTPGFFDWFTTRQTVQYFMDQRETYNNVTLTPFLNFVMVWNQGVSFGLFDGAAGDTEKGARMMSMIFIALSLVISLLMVIWLGLARRRCLAWALALIVGGAVGNVIDRVRFGAVADFVDLHYAGLHWPAFNVADSAIVIGAILMILDTMLCKDKHTFLG